MWFNWFVSGWCLSAGVGAALTGDWGWAIALCTLSIANLILAIMGDWS